MGIVRDCTAGHTVQLIIDYCDSKWREADQATDTDWPPPDRLAGMKMAYNDVLHFARSQSDACGTP